MDAQVQVSEHLLVRQEGPEHNDALNARTEFCIAVDLVCFFDDCRQQALSLLACNASADIRVRELRQLLRAGILAAGLDDISRRIESTIGTPNASANRSSENIFISASWLAQ
jgi:hypothetical protein